MKNQSTHAKVIRLAQLAVFSALIIVLQVLATVIPMPTVKITLTLIPIVLGGIYFGKGAATCLGAVFGVVAAIMSVIGFDIGGHMMFEANPLLTIFICFAKGILAGLVSAVLYELLSRKISDFWASIMAAAAAPITNTGIFLAFLYSFYPEVLTSWAGGQDIWMYIITALVLLNFIPELLLNVILCPIIAKKVKIK